MKVMVTRRVTEEVEVKAIRVCVPVRYGDEDIPYDFPFRTGDVWDVTIDAETGVIQGWPEGVAEYVHMKVVDGGHYQVLGNDGSVLVDVSDDYVPKFVPGEYGDYVVMNIDGTGRVEGWPKPDVLAERIHRYTETDE